MKIKKNGAVDIAKNLDVKGGLTVDNTLHAKGGLAVGENRVGEVTIVRHGSFYVHYLSFGCTGATPKKFKVVPESGIYAYWSAEVNKFSFMMTNGCNCHAFESGHFFGHTCYAANFVSQITNGAYRTQCQLCGELRVRKTVLKPGGSCGSGGNYMVTVTMMTTRLP